MPNILASGADGFQIWHDYEYALLHWEGGSLPLGDHYGDPACALLSPDHGWCVIGGEGIVVFDFGGPFSRNDPPSLDGCSSAELWRRENPPSDSTPCWFVSELAVIDPEHVRAVIDGQGSVEVNLRTLEWRGL